MPSTIFTDIDYNQMKVVEGNTDYSFYINSPGPMGKDQKSGDSRVTRQHQTSCEHLLKNLPVCQRREALRGAC